MYIKYNIFNIFNIWPFNYQLTQAIGFIFFFKLIVLYLNSIRIKQKKLFLQTITFEILKYKKISLVIGHSFIEKYSGLGV